MSEPSAPPETRRSWWTGCHARADGQRGLNFVWPKQMRFKGVALRTADFFLVALEYLELFHSTDVKYAHRLIP